MDVKGAKIWWEECITLSKLTFEEAVTLTEMVDNLFAEAERLTSEVKTAYKAGMLAAAEIAEDVPTTVSLYVNSHDASVATRAKEVIVMAIEAEAVRG